MRLNMPVLIVIAGAIIAVGGWLTVDFLVESDEERVAAFIERMAAQLTTREAEAYLDFINLDEFGFRLDVRGHKMVFGPEDRAAFLAATRAYVSMINGSEIDLKSVDVTLPTEGLAEVEVRLTWRRGSAKATGVSQAQLAVSGRLALDDKSWKVTTLRVIPAFELMKPGRLRK